MYSGLFKSYLVCLSVCMYFTIYVLSVLVGVKMSGCCLIRFVKFIKPISFVHSSPVCMLQVKADNDCQMYACVTYVHEG